MLIKMSIEPSSGHLQGGLRAARAVSHMKNENALPLIWASSA